LAIKWFFPKIGKVADLTVGASYFCTPIIYDSIPFSLEPGP